MKQDILSEVTKRAIEAPREITEHLLEKTEKIKNPSPEVRKIGNNISNVLAVSLIVFGVGQVIFTKSAWGVGNFAIGATTIVSNKIYKHIKKI